MNKAVVMPAVLAVGIVCAPLAQAESGDRADAEQAVTAIYNQVQARCTPRTPPAFQSISWNDFYPAVGGTGRIHDANAGLGGPFKVSYRNPRVGPATDGPAGRAYGQWGVDLEFC
ncbi:hypothetical protein A5760_01245 [Mycobacterium colombiense]|uniref:Uncharacterized protein n=1 Tax=Mycobacterium colombiense TaxID=339268 RepID=A0A1A0VA16_9MYCO|nr:hypothetical protein [Mycobacterium colombiense]OBB80064.1 hypothetical protein A5760_01245 [Mycobacterium colombiense]